MSGIGEIAAPTTDATAATPAQVHAASEVDAIAADLLAGKLTPGKLESAEGLEADAAREDGEEEPPAAKAKEAAKEEKFDAAVNAAKRAKSAAARNREHVSNSEKQQQAIAQRDAEIYRARQQTAAAQAETRHLREWEQGLAKDPYAALQERGMTPEQITQRILKDGSPEALIEQARGEAKQVAAELAAFKAEMASQAARVARAQVEGSFFAEAGKAESYPNLAELPRKFILPAVNQLQADLLSEGYAQSEISALTHDQVCTLLEREFAGARKAKAAPVAAAVEAQRTPPKTLTNRIASAKITAPSNYDDLPIEEQTKHLNKMARALGVGRQPEE